MSHPTSPVRVLHVGKFYPPAKGGMETVLALLCEAEQSRVNSQVIVSNTERATVREQRNGVNVLRVGTLAKVGAVAISPTLPFWLARTPADVIVIHEPNPVALLSYFLVRPRARLLVWFHSEVIRPRWRYRLFYEPILRFALKRAARIIIATPTLAEAADALRPFRQKCVVVPFGVDPDRLNVPPPERIDEVRRRYGTPMVLFVGRMVRYKGVDVLIQAIQRLEARLVLVGDGPERPALERLAAQRGVATRIVFTGEIDDDELAALYHACDIFVLPSVSTQEAFGMVQLEAMLCSKPVISTELASGVPWVNQHGRTGLVVPPRDVESLRDALVKLLNDPALRDKMGHCGRTRVRTIFRVDRMAQDMVALYHMVSGMAAEEVPPGRATDVAS